MSFCKRSINDAMEVPTGKSNAAPGANAHHSMEVLCHAGNDLHNHHLASLQC
ncbi:hypothetical protein RSSM_06691 [Rhodopirellula sallentina SM41]|uniref:Uncharacterized protein n=1 Tax=Rhodopirellula sallentina SM41 TaxID=1263870 RepID=M5TRR3_9BACT|nr:hypothetical protein RSSM_06691 [Rhodopirellula sallentina SM41]